MCGGVFDVIACGDGRGSGLGVFVETGMGGLHERLWVFFWFVWFFVVCWDLWFSADGD